ncbi:MAG TPA: tetratricopeptide repeat protein [Anaerolineales bacterium]|nr:tetratricopeptide repeat protein [Anaerolineales bacterium]
MSDSDTKDTQPTPATAATQVNPPVQAGPKKNFPRWLPPAIFVLLIVIGLLAGYGSGMGQRFAAQNTVVAGQNLEQYQLGMQALQAGEYDIAKQHFDSIIQTDPNFPGIKDAYAELLVRMQVSPTPLFTPTSLYTATPDTRSSDQIFQRAQDSLNAGNWDDALANLDILRKNAPDYQTAQVDGMYYMALRQRGMSKISNTDCKNINLEGGIYDLTLAERFVGTGNLDSTAEAYRTWARMYIVGSSFWGLDWAQAQNYFSQVMNALPNLSDSSCKTATQRWRDATIQYAEQLASQGKICQAKDQFDAAFRVGGPADQGVYPTATAVDYQCTGGNSGGGGSSADTATPGGETPTSEAPTATEPPTATNP